MTVRSDAMKVLAVTTLELGWATYAAALAQALEHRTDVEAVHLAAAPPLLVRASGAKLPGRRLTGRLDPHYRRSLTTGRWIADLVGRRSDLDEFDLIHVTPHLAAAGLIRRPGMPPISVGLDATVLQSKQSRLGLTTEAAERRHAPLRSLERDILDASSTVVCMSSWARDAVIAEGRRVDGVVVAPPAARAGSQVRSVDTDGSAQRSIQAVFVGNAWERKGGPELIDVHQRRFADRIDLHICSATAPVDHTLRNVHWHGAVDHDHLLDSVLPSMDIFVLPTRSDMSPWAVAEALVAGLPVISTDVGGIGELVRNGVEGFLSPPGDLDTLAHNLAQVVDDPALLRRLTEAAIEAGRTRLAISTMGDTFADAWYDAGYASTPATRGPR